MLVIFWVLLNVAILMTFDILSFGLKRTGWVRFSSTFFLFYCQIIATEFMLGLVSLLNSFDLSFLNIIITSCLIYYLQRKFGSNIFKKYLINIRQIFRNAIKDIKSNPLFLILLSIAFILLAWIIFLGIIFPAIDWDGNSYHQTFIGYAIQNHNFYDIPTSLKWLAGYPKGGEFIELWNVMIINNDTFVDLVQIPFLLLGIYSLYEVSKKLGVNRQNAKFTALLYLFLPIVINQLKTTYIDVMLCSLMFAGLAMVLKEKLNKLDLLIVGIIFSLIISLKFTGILFIIILTPLLIWNLHKNINKKIININKYYFNKLIIVFLPILFGLYWYVKNLILYNNPMYPFGLKVMGLTIFPGKTFQDLAADAALTVTSLPKGCLNRIWFVWTEQKDWYGCLYNYDANFTGFGPIWFVILIPAIVIAIVIAIRKRNYLYMIISALIIAILSIYPSNYYSRYTMFIVAIGIFSLGIVLSEINNKVSNFVKLITIIIAVIVFATNFTLCNFAPGMVKNQFQSLMAGNSRSLAYKNAIGESYLFLQNKIKSKEVVVYDSSPYFIYALWKPDYSNVVTYIKADTKEKWQEKAKRERVRYLFTLIGSSEHKWFKDDIAIKSIYKDSMYEIFQLY